MTLFIVELLPIPYAVIFGTRIASYALTKTTSESRLLSEMNLAEDAAAEEIETVSSANSALLQLLYSGLFLGFLLMVYYLKSLDFDQRVIERTFGVK